MSRPQLFAHTHNALPCRPLDALQPRHQAYAVARSSLTSETVTLREELCSGSVRGWHLARTTGACGSMTRPNGPPAQRPATSGLHLPLSCAATKTQCSSRYCAQPYVNCVTHL